MKCHKYEVLLLPCEIDVKMVDLVLALNNLEGIRTLYCCQGKTKPEKANVYIPELGTIKETLIYLPYISFRYEVKSEISVIIEEFEKKEKLFEVRDSAYSKNELYLQFKNQRQVERFTKWILKN